MNERPERLESPPPVTGVSSTCFGYFGITFEIEHYREISDLASLSSIQLGYDSPRRHS